MHKFKDSNGREWNVAMNVTAIKRVRDVLSVDLLEFDIGSGKVPTMLAVADDPIDLVNVLFVLCQDQAAASNVSDVQFGESMGGDSLDMAEAAFLEALTDFFPKGKRPALREAIAMRKRLQEAQITAATKELQAIDVNKLVESVTSPAGNTSIESPDSSGSPQDLTPSEN